MQSKDVNAAASLAVQVRRAINGLAGIHYTGPIIGLEGTAATAPAMLAGMPPGTVHAALNLVKSMTARQCPPDLTITITTDGLNAAFNPQTITTDQLASLATALQNTLPV